MQNTVNKEQRIERTETQSDILSSFCRLCVFYESKTMSSLTLGFSSISKQLAKYTPNCCKSIRNSYRYDAYIKPSIDSSLTSIVRLSRASSIANYQNGALGHYKLCWFLSSQRRPRKRGRGRETVAKPVRQIPLWNFSMRQHSGGDLAILS